MSARTVPGVTAAERLLVHAARAVVRCYPAEFRRLLGRDLIATFEMQAIGARRRGGLAGLLRYGLPNLARLAGGAARARCTPSRSPFLPTRRGDPPMTTLSQDLRYAARNLRRSPGFTLIAVATLALGIGASTAIFSVVDGVLLRPLPYDEPERIVAYFNTRLPDRGFSNPMSLNEAWEYKQRSAEAFESFAAYQTWTASVTGDGEPLKINSARVMAGFFETFGVEAMLGRTFAPEEDRPGDDAVVVLTHGFWQQRYGADPGVVGETLVLDGRARTIVGVMPASFAFPDIADIYVPLAIDPAALDESSLQIHFLAGVARLRAGSSLSQAHEAAERIVNAVGEVYPEHVGGRYGALLVPLHEFIVGDVGGGLWALLASVGFLLLIGCVNVANLLLARADTRQREIAVRTALGAGRGRLVRQLVTESLLLAGLAGTLGLLLTIAGFRLLLALLPPGMPRTGDIGIDLTVLGFALAVSLCTGMAFGLAPALQAARQAPQAALRRTGRGSSGGRGGAVARGALVVAEVALVLVLMVGAGLAIKSFWRLTRVDTGIEPAAALTFGISLPPDYETRAEIEAFFAEIHERLAALPGVSAVGGVSPLPYGSFYANWRMEIEGVPWSSRDELPHFDFAYVDGDYFDAVGMPLVAGRDFGRYEGDARTGVLVNETAARTFWPEEGAIGRRLKMNEDTVWRTVIGVTADHRNRGFSEDPAPIVYLPNRDVDPASRWFTRSLTMVLRIAGGAPEDVAGLVRREVWAIDPDLPLADLRTLQSVMAGVVAEPRFTMSLLLAFAGLAVLLGSVGIYGVVAYAVTQRTRELGIRLALGARAPQVVRLVMLRGIGLVVAGIGTGLLAAFGAARLMMASVLFEVGAGDPATFAAVALLLAAVGMLAAWMPARRATRIDPAVSLRANL